MKTSDNVTSAPAGLVAESVWRSHLKDYDLTLLAKLRQRLAGDVPDLAEKFNSGQIKYFGYRRGDRADGVYIYLQKQSLRIDLNIPPAFAPDLRRAGFTITHHDNFQGQAGWLTGWRIPLDWPDADEIVKWLKLALERS